MWITNFSFYVGALYLWSKILLKLFYKIHYVGFILSHSMQIIHEFLITRLNKPLGPMLLVSYLVNEIFHQLCMIFDNCFPCRNSLSLAKVPYNASDHIDKSEQNLYKADQHIENKIFIKASWIEVCLKKVWSYSHIILCYKSTIIYKNICLFPGGVILLHVSRGCIVLIFPLLSHMYLCARFTFVCLMWSVLFYRWDTFSNFYSFMWLVSVRRIFCMEEF